MKKSVQITLIIILIALCFESMAQSTLLYYWHFNTLTTANINYGRDLLINSDSTTPVIAAPGTVTWQLQAGTPVGDTIGIADNASGDLLNARGSALNTLAANNWGLRPRNPGQYGQLVFNIPTTGFQNIIIKFESEASSIYPKSGIGLQLFDYSVDGGNTFSSTGITVTSPKSAPLTNEDSLTTAWELVTVDLTIAVAVNDISNLVFRIRYTGSNAIQSQTSGNDRFDNVTVEGTSTTTTSTTGSSAMDAGYNLYPNPSADGQIYFTAPTSSVKNITFYNTSGQPVYTTSVSGTGSGVNVGTLISGVYYVNVNDANNNYTLKFIKN